MKKKILISVITILSLLSISIYSFAMENVANNIRNFVGGAENKVEEIGNNVSGGIKNGMNTLENGTENVINDVKDDSRDAENTVSGAITDNNNGYTATTTSSEQGMMINSTNMWTWVILGVILLAIGLMIWSYVRNKNNNDMYIDPDDRDQY